MNPNDSAQVDRIAAARLGATPAPQPGPNEQVSATPQNVDVPNPTADKAENAKEAAEKTASPETEGDASQQPPVSYKIKFGDEERELTEEQIRGTFDRYKALNHKNAQLRPAYEIVEKLAEKLGDPKKVADLTAHALRSLSNTPNSNQNPKATERPDPDTGGGQETNEQVSQRLEEWEQNFGELPPGYKEMLGFQPKVTDAINQMTAMFQKMMEQGQGTVQRAQEINEDTKGRQVDAAKETLMTNLNAAQQKFAFDDSEVSAFQQFAGSRGYTMEDFLDRDVLMAVAEDFNNSKNSGELERLREIENRRQAAMGSEGSVPGTGGAAALSPQEDQIARMARRGHEAIQNGRRQ